MFDVIAVKQLKVLKHVYALSFERQEVSMPKIKAPPVNPTTLAWFAEGAHGQQDQTLYIVEEDGDLVLTDKDPRPGKQPVLEVVPKNERPPLKKAHKIALQLKAGGVERNLLRDPQFVGCDALFWTASSIEKFMFPYYHAQRLYGQEEICSLMARYRANRSLVAAVHVAPSRPGSIGLLDTAAFVMATKDEKDLDLISFKEFLNL
jgi:hypothetical protein